MGAVGGTYDGELAANVTINDGEVIVGVNNSTCMWRSSKVSFSFGFVLIGPLVRNWMLDFFSFFF